MTKKIVVAVLDKIVKVLIRMKKARLRAIRKSGKSMMFGVEEILLKAEIEELENIVEDYDS